MARNCYQLVPNADWETLILEVQTDPDDDMSSDAYVRLYLEISDYLEIIACKWLNSRGFTEAHDGALVAIGLEKIFRDIGKFILPDADSIRIERAFKAWVGICCRREWTKKAVFEYQTDPAMGVDATNKEEFYEDNPVTQLEDDKSTSRPTTEKELQQKILQEELNTLPQSMQDAILATEDLKSVERPHSRGKQGEAKSIAEKYSYSPGAIRTQRSRLLKKVKERFEKESLK